MRSRLSESFYGGPALDESTNSIRGRVPTLMDRLEAWEY